MTQHEAQLDRLSAIGLTPRQEEVMRLVARGKTYGEVSDALGITLDGVKWHMREVLTKLNVNSREEAVTAWRYERSVGQRFRRFARALAPFFGLHGIVAGGAAAVLVSAAVVGGAVAWSSITTGAASTAPPSEDSKTTAAPSPTPAGPLIPESTIAELKAFRDDLVNKPLAIDPTYVQRALPNDPVLVTNVNFGPITDFQRDILSDGLVTLAEYRSAEEAYRTCEIANGFSVAPLELTGIDRYTSPATNMPGDMLSNRGLSGVTHAVADSRLIGCPQD